MSEPLYRPYADHFAVPGAAAGGPSARALARTLERALMRPADANRLLGSYSAVRVYVVDAEGSTDGS